MALLQSLSSSIQLFVQPKFIRLFWKNKIFDIENRECENRSRRTFEDGISLNFDDFLKLKRQFRNQVIPDFKAISKNFQNDNYQTNLLLKTGGFCNFIEV